MAVNTQNGWTAGSISHDADLHDAALASRKTVDAPAPKPAGSSVGLLNAYAQSPLSAAQLLTDPSHLHDSSLGSRTYMNPGTGLRDAAAVGSVYQQNDVPAFLQQSIANLNAEQTMKRAMQAELVNRILAGVQQGGPNDYLWAEALRGAAVNPGAHVAFNAAIQNPLLGQGYKTAADAFAQKTAQQTTSLKNANTALNSIAPLEQQRAKLGNVVMGGYTGSSQQQLDQQITDSYVNAGPSSATQMLGRAAGSGSGWLPTLPTY
jgi:hypothetical protein